MDETSSPDYEFGGFRLDTTQQVLIAPGGEPLPLQSRAFATLRYLVERAGEIVDKSTLMARVWPTTVVAENNLNQCILALRKALGESAGERRFILTVPGRGFKFVAPVTVVPREHFGPALRPGAGATAPNPASRSRGGWRLAAGLALTGVAAVLLWHWLGRHGAVTDPAEYVQLTDVTDGAVAPVLSPDGRLLAFIRNGGPFMGRGQVWAKVLPGGEPVKLTESPGPLWAPAFTPDSANVVYSAIDLEHGSWDTWTVPVSGGVAATRLLPNAQALTYIGPHQVLYSEFQRGVHLAVVTARDDRSAHRQVYAPAHERGMAHFSYLSPDRKWILVAEMGSTGRFGRCRVAPFDGRTAGFEVGPQTGACLNAAWSPDGRWMYFSDDALGVSHLWRQRFPDGPVERITFGPTEEQTVFPMPDGHSLLTAIGLTQTTLWFHKGDTERILTTEGRVFSPWLSADARHVYFLMARGDAMAYSLSRMDMASGRPEALLPDIKVLEFDISPDERQVVFTTVQGDQHEIWIAPLDRHASPMRLAHSADQPRFGGPYIYFRHVGEHASYLHRVKRDGRDEARLQAEPIIQISAAAPDGKAVVVDRPDAQAMGNPWVIPIDSTAEARMLNTGFSHARWSLDGKTLYVGVNVQGHAALSGSTVALPTGPDDLPLSPKLAAEAGGMTIPHEDDGLWMAADPSTYVYVKSERRQNIYRVPLH